MPIGWNFPKNNNGPLTGISEAGVETFKGTPFSSLAREICQNSLDVQVDKSKPVIIEFEEFKMKTEDLDCHNDLKDAFERCKEFWKVQSNNKTIKFFEKALTVISKEEISILRISDFNTTGLTGSDKDYNTQWQDLIKGNGVSDKGGTSGGSFGIGKFAPFACSQLRTIYYSTLDKEDLKASQGVARLVSFRDKDSDITQGIGYFGDTEKNTPMTDLIRFNNSFSRNRTGTDIYILGFNSDEEWQAEVIKAILDSFLVSILNEQLVVKVGDIDISKDTLHTLIEKYKEEIKLTYNYYQVLTSEQSQVLELYINGLGNIELHVLLKQNLYRKVLMSRSNGMKIFDKANISSTIHFAGVLILKDENVDIYFKNMENPQHNAWEPDRHPNPKEAKKITKGLYSLIKDEIIKLGRNNISDESDPEGVGDYLPDEVALGQFQEKIDKQKAILDKTKDIKIDVKKHVGSPTTGEGDYDKNKIKAKVRLFVVNKATNKYKLTFISEESVEKAYVYIKLSGEQSNIAANVKKALLNDDKSKPLKCKKGKIYVSKIVANKKNVLSFILDYSDSCSMEAGLYGHTS